MKIPQEYIQVCKDMAKVARANHLTKFHGEFSPPFNAGLQLNKIEFNWDAGRHNEDIGEIHIHADTWIQTKVDDK